MTLEFMAENPNDIFRIIMPLNLQIDFEDYGKSHFNVVITNINKNETFLFEMSPELLFTHYSVENYFINGNIDKTNTNHEIYNKTFTINTDISSKESDVKLSEVLTEKNIVSLLGWKRKFLFNAKNNHCYLIKQNGLNIIIPHYSIAIYYYYRFTHSREAVLNCKLDDLYLACDCNIDNEATIILDEPRTDIDAAFIHRFASKDFARKCFQDIGTHLNNYLRYMKDNYPKNKVEHIPIKALFPVKGSFDIAGRVSKLKNEDTGKIYHFVHEIIGDNADIGFDKFAKKIERKSVSTKIDSLENLAKVQKNIPEETTQILKRENATKKYTQSKVVKSKKTSFTSIDNISVQREDITTEETIQILKIYKEVLNGPVDKSLTDSSVSGGKNTRKTVVSTNFDFDDEKDNNKKYTHNFDEFNHYMNYLSSSKVIKNFRRLGVDNLPKVMDKLDPRKTNKKCIIQGRAKQYITCTFEYNNLHVGLLDLENAPNDSSSTWVIVSLTKISKNTFDTFIFHYLDNNYSTNNISDLYKDNSNIKFTKKNHEKSTNLKEGNSIRWVSGILGKVTI